MSPGRKGVDAKTWREEVRDRFVRRDLTLGGQYSINRPDVAMRVAEKHAMVMKWLSINFSLPLEEVQLLDVGCGAGDELSRWCAAGLPEDHAHGIDLIPERIDLGRQSHPGLDLRVGSADQLPWPDGTFDIVTQSTVLSSMPADARRTVAAEMIRVLKPLGVVISYDFHLNPFHPESHPISRDEITQLFPGMRFEIHRTTLAPPLARALAPRAPALARAARSIPMLRTHYLAFVTHNH